MMYPLVFGVVAFLYVTQGFSLIDTENQNLTDFLLNIPTGKDSDVLRQLLNQETIMRMSMVKNLHLLMQDVVTLKEDMVSMQDMVDSLKRESDELKRENQRLNGENLNLKKQLDVVNTTIKQQLDFVNINVDNITSEILQIKNEQNQFERNISGILGDIKIEVRYLSVTLLNLNDHTHELDKSIPERLQEYNRSVFDFVNRTYDRLTDSLTEADGRQLELHSSVLDLKIFRANVTKLLAEDINNTITTLQRNIQQWVQDQDKLSLKVTSLELVHSKGKVGFTVGVTSSSSTWSGSTLVFDKVIFYIGGGYSTSTGIFTSPTDGTFVFYIAVVSYYTKQLYLDIVLNGNSMVKTMSHMSSSAKLYQTGTNMALVRLQKGDKVWVKRYSGGGYYTYDTPLTTFSGFRIY